MRQKPDHVKKQYALVVSAGFTAIILIFWLASFSVGSDAKAVAAQVKSPMQSMTASASDAFGYVKDMIFGKNKTNYSSDNVEVTGGKI